MQARRRTGSPGSAPSLKLGHPFLHLSPIWFWLQGKTPLSAKPRIKWTSPALLSWPLPQAKPRQPVVCVWGGETQGPLRISLPTCFGFSQACDFILPTQGPCSGYFPGFHTGLSVPEAPGSKARSCLRFLRTVEVNLLSCH